MAKVGIVIPSRNERFLEPTVRDLLAKARGDVCVVAMLDGYWPNPPLPDDRRVRVAHFGAPRGMRNAITAGVEIARQAGCTHLIKADGHTMWDEGYDLKLLADYREDNWILVPRRYALEPEKWEIDTSNSKYPIDYHYLAEPFNRYGDSTAGLHGTAWNERKRRRKDVELDTELASQGSGYFVSMKCWDWLGGLDQSLYGSFWLENLELSMKCFMRGGQQMVTKRTWYAHLYKGHRYGRGYNTKGMGHEDALTYSTWFWMTDQPLQGRTRTMKSLIEEFSPVPTWPEDLDAIFDRARRECRNPYQVAA